MDAAPGSLACMTQAFLAAARGYVLHHCTAHATRMLSVFSLASHANGGSRICSWMRAVDAWCSFMRDQGVKHVISLLSPSEHETYQQPLLPQLEKDFTVAAVEPTAPGAR